MLGVSITALVIAVPLLFAAIGKLFMFGEVSTLKVRYNFGKLGWNSLSIGESAASLLLIAALIAGNPWIGFLGAGLAALSSLFVLTKLAAARETLPNFVVAASILLISIIHIVLWTAI